jgi:hypothetical protein
MAQQRVAIIPGVATGWKPWRHFAACLQQAGYKIVRDSEEADIIIAHSAGCFWLPQGPTHQRLLLIDPPYWPGRSVRQRTLSRLKSNANFRAHGYSFVWWLWRNLWGAYTAARELNHTRDILRHVRVFDLDATLTNHVAILVRNHHDDWLTSDLEPLAQRHPQLTIVQLPGDHEDCMHHPQAYIKLLELFKKS